MTYGEPSEYDFTARDIVNGWDENVIADILFGYAEEKHARRIAKAIVLARKKNQIATTGDLLAIIESVLPTTKFRGKIHPATKTFQALRIAVNSELSMLETFIRDGFTLLKPDGRLAIITFHSIEDRVVKHLFLEFKSASMAELVTKKPIVPTREEMIRNPRSRSAKMRIITKLKD